MAGGVDAPFLDDGETWAPTFSTPPGVYAPFLESGAGFAPMLGGAPTSGGLEVKTGATVLDGSFARSFLDELTGTGSFQVSLPNDDAGMPDFDDILTFEVDGLTRFAGLVEAKRVVTFGQGEEADEVTAISGRGRLAITDGATVEPARGLDALPVELTRSFSWVSVDFSAPGWAAAKRIRRSDVPTALPPNRYSPEWWPDKTSWWVWANRPDVSETSAPGGRCLFRTAQGEINLAEDATIAIFAAMDNYGTVYFDGAKVMDSENDASSYTIGRRVQLEVSAGDHVLAANVLNTGKGGGFNWTIWTVDDEGLLDTLVAHSDSDTTKCLPYPFPDNPPTVTATWAIRQIVEEAQARGELSDLVLDFTDTTDSGGNPATPVTEITVEVGRTLLETLESLTDWLIDVQMAPGANVLRVWNWGTRGGTPGVSIAATADPNTSEVEGLSHDGRHVRANRLLIKYRQGYTEVVDSTSVTAHGQRTAFLDLSDVDTESTAKGIGTRLLSLRKDPLYGHTLTLAPVSSQPYDAFDNGDYIGHLDESGVSDDFRVRSIAMSEDQDELTWVLSTNVDRQEALLRHENWLKRKAMGALAGGARVSSRSGEGLEPAVRISTTDVVEFSFQDPVDGAITGKSPADSSGNLIEIYVEVSTENDAATSSETVVRVWQYVHGTTAPTSIGTVTVPAGAASAEVDLEAAKVFRNIYKYRAEAVTVGGGVNAISVKLRAI